MQILSIGLDKDIFRENSDSRKRQIEYGKLFDETHIIVFTKKGFSEQKISDNVWVYPTNSRNRLLYIFDAIKIGKQIIQNSKFEVNNSIITSQDPFETGLVGWFLKKKFRIQLVIQIHTEMPFRYFAFESFLNFFRWFLARFLIPKADRLRVVSLTIKNYILSQFKYPINKISVLPVIVDIEKIKNQLPKIDIKEKYPGHDFYFLTAARLVKFKNISLQLKVIAKLIAEFPNTLLLIVGDGPEKKKLEKISKHLNIEKNVIFESWQKDIISYMKTADCFLFSSNYEGYGRTIIESLSSGLSVIATKVGIAPEVIQDGKNGYLVNVGNIEEYYKACKKIIQSPIKKEQVLDVNFPILKKEEYLKNYQTIFTI